ncbi:MAG: TatD family hydrolase [Bacteroidales bacterium]|nr:TatD family hydrolase [Bacteroidales bacterium]
MNQLFDFHTHNPEATHAIIDLEPGVEPISLHPERLYSVGIHPWSLKDLNSDTLATSWDAVERLARLPNVVAIGETGFDRVMDGCAEGLARQEELFARHVALSELLEKPLIIHNVRASDLILAHHKLLKPRQQWTIHGFRGKPQEATMLRSHGLRLSFGPRFNPSTVALIPEEELLIETDDSGLTIDQVYQRIYPYIHNGNNQF